MEVLLDSNFIISCIRKKIDFISQLEELGFKVILPKEVMEELKDLKRNIKESHEDRVAIDLALQLFESDKIKRMTLGGALRKKASVDKALIHYGKNGAYIATLDNAIKRSVPNRVVISNSGNKVVIERD